MDQFITMGELPTIRNLADADMCLQALEHAAVSVQHDRARRMSGKCKERQTINSLFDKFMAICNNMARAVERSTAYNLPMAKDKPQAAQLQAIALKDSWLTMRGHASKARKGLIKFKEVVMEEDKIY